MNAATVNLDPASMGIQDFEAAIKAQKMTPKQVLDILDQRIQKRQLLKKPPVARVIQYRNELATAIAKATKTTPQLVPEPVFAAKQQPNTALPSDPEKLADAVFFAVGPKGATELIGRLTARVARA